MRKQLGGAVAVGAVLVAFFGVYGFVQKGERGGVSSGELSTHAREVEIVLTPEGYMPREITIKKGTKVTFTNTTGKPHWPASNLHPTHNIYSEFDPREPVPHDESWAFVFERVGRHNFHDHIRAYYVGTIYVVE